MPEKFHTEARRVIESLEEALYYAENLLDAAYTLLVENGVNEESSLMKDINEFLDAAEVDGDGSDED